MQHPVLKNDSYFWLPKAVHPRKSLFETVANCAIYKSPNERGGKRQAAE